MTILEIVKYPDPVLKEKTPEVEDFDEALGRLLDDMAETMYPANGLGLASPQVGVLKRVAVVDVSEDRNKLIELVNPKITWKEGEVPSEEGCLSIPDYRDTITRSREIVVEAQDRHGQSFKLKADDLLAICIQHEIDHLDGVLFIDRLSRLKRDIFKRWFKKQEKFE